MFKLSFPHKYNMTTYLCASGQITLDSCQLLIQILLLTCPNISIHLGFCLSKLLYCHNHHAFLLYKQEILSKFHYIHTVTVHADQFIHVSFFFVQYEAVTVPFPKDTESANIDKKEIELVRDFTGLLCFCTLFLPCRF